MTKIAEPSDNIGTVLGVDLKGDFRTLRVDETGAVVHTLTREAWRNLYAAVAMQVMLAKDPDDRSMAVYRAFEVAALALAQQDERPIK